MSSDIIDSKKRVDVSQKQDIVKMVLHWLGFAFLLLIGFMFFAGGGLNLLGCGDRIGDKYKVSNIIECLAGIVIFVGAFFLKQENDDVNLIEGYI